MKKKAVIVGYSGHAYVVLDVLLSNNYEIVGYCEQAPKTSNPYDLVYLGNETNLEVLSLLKGCDLFIGIGDNSIRGKIYDQMILKQINCPSIIDTFAKVSALAKIGTGTIILPGVVINSCAVIGNAVICNTSSIIEHECEIGDYSHIAPGAVLAGNVKVGEYSFIGANSVIKQGVNIGSKVVVGAGAVVIKDIPDGAVVYGNPARIR